MAGLVGRAWAEIFRRSHGRRLRKLEPAWHNGDRLNLWGRLFYAGRHRNRYTHEPPWQQALRRLHSGAPPLRGVVVAL